MSISYDNFKHRFFCKALIFKKIVKFEYQGGATRECKAKRCIQNEYQ